MEKFVTLHDEEDGLDLRRAIEHARNNHKSDTDILNELLACLPEEPPPRIRDLAEAERAVIQHMQALLNQPSKWIKGALARTDDYYRIKYTSSKATRFSLYGAFMRAIDRVAVEHKLNFFEKRELTLKVSGTINHRFIVSRTRGAYHSLHQFGDAAEITYEDIQALFYDMLKAL